MSRERAHCRRPQGSLQKRRRTSHSQVAAGDSCAKTCRKGLTSPIFRLPGAGAPARATPEAKPLDTWPSPALSKLNTLTARSGASRVAPAVKNLPVNAADPGSTPGSGRSPGGGSGHPLQYLVWEIPRTEESGGLQSKGSQRAGPNLVTK